MKKLDPNELWAKTGEADRYHGLLSHMLDTAAVADRLWEKLPRSATEAPRRTLGADARRLCAFLAGAHDVGKANPYFQSKVRSQRIRLESAFGLKLPRAEEPKRHGHATVALLFDWLSASAGWKRLVARSIALAVGGHHGRFPFDEGSPKRLAGQLCVDREPWLTLGKRLLDEVYGALGAPTFPAEILEIGPFLGWLSGFVSVADWLASHDAMVGFVGEQVEAKAYIVEALARAESALSEIGWLEPLSGQSVGMERLLPPGSEPNLLQKTVDGIGDWTLALIEAPMGAGKTEAAFALMADALAGGSGAFFALPTTATANAQLSRAERFLREVFGAGVAPRLVHSEARVARPCMREAEAVDWFAGPKRGLLAAYAVGTVDQALLASLRARHGFVRLFALAGKVLVVDEVHAYDVYMSELLNRLLQWLRALDSRVVLLSATLPRARRNELLRAWLGREPECEAPYPRVTWYSPSGGVECRHVPMQLGKQFHLRKVAAGDDWVSEAVKLAICAISDRPGPAALIFNTVRRAQQALRTLAPLGVPCRLFHGRYTALDRQRIERQVLEVYGKHSRDRGASVLVATQVVEQSLDLDFDHMVTELAPIDLLLQRAGRLHRHPRRRDGALSVWDERPDPVLQVVCSTGSNGEPILSDGVYSELVLLRTWESLDRHGVIRDARDIESAVEAVYSESDRDGVLGEWRQRLERAEKEATQRREVSLRTAEAVMVPRPDDPDRLIVEADLELDENDQWRESSLVARTRLEDRPSVEIVLLNENRRTVHDGDPNDPFDRHLATVRCSPPGDLYKDLHELDPPKWLPAAARGIGQVPLVLREGNAVVGRYNLKYGDLGLEWERQP